MKKISLSILLCLLFSCSVPVQNISQNIDKTETKNDKQFETKSLARFEHPNSRAELNDIAYDYAFSDMNSGDAAITHYAYARNTYSEYQARIRAPEYFTALKCIADGFDEQSYLNAHPDVQAAVNAGSQPSGYFHYKTVGKNENRLSGQTYNDKLKINKVFREEAYFNANPGLHPGISATLDNNFTSTAYPVNGYEYYVLNRYAGNNTLNNSTYQTALNDHIDGYWEDSYLYAYGDIR